MDRVKRPKHGGFYFVSYIYIYIKKNDPSARPQTASGILSLLAKHCGGHSREQEKSRKKRRGKRKRKRNRKRKEEEEEQEYEEEEEYEDA